MATTRPMLIMRNMLASESQCAVYKFIDGFLSKIGNDFGLVEIINSNKHNVNRVTHWQNDLYCANKQQVWKYAAESGAWGVAATLPEAASTDNIGGFHTITYASGVSKMVGFYASASNAWRPIIIDEVGSISFGTSKVGRLGTGAALEGFIDIIPLKDKVYILSRSTSPLLTRWEPVTDTDIVITNPSSYDLERIIELNGDIYGVCTTTAGFTRIYKLEGPTWTFQAALAPGADAAQCPVWTDGISKIYYMYSTFPGATGGWSVNSYDINTKALVDITSATRPAGMSAAGQASARNIEVVDQESNPGGAPDIYILHSNTSAAAQSVSIYKWNGESTLMSFIGDGADMLGYGFPRGGKGDGTRVWSGINEFYISCNNATIDGATISFDFKLTGSDTGVSLDFYFESAGGYRNAQATISSSTIGTLSGGTITGLTATTAGTTGRVTWNASADGVSPADFPSIIGRAYKP